MYKEFISQIEKLDTLYFLIIGLVGWVSFLLTFIFRRRNMQNILKRLEKEVEVKSLKINNLEIELKLLKKERMDLETDIQTLKTSHPGLKSTTLNEIKEVVKTFEKEWLFTEYESNYFAREKGKKKDELNNEVVYKIILETEKKGIFDLVNKENADYIPNKDFYLLPGLCSLNYSENSTRKKIGSTQPGKVHLDADKWIVDEKVQIEIL
jgi:hypothetical protein